MNLTWDQIKNNAISFSKRWKDAKNERAEAQLFLHELLGVFGLDSKRVATFEQKIHPEADTNGYIDLLWPGRILFEMKSKGKSLEKAFKQARDYAFAIEKDEDLPEYILVCDFENIRLYRQTTNQQWSFKTKDLSKNIKKLSVLTDQATKLDFLVDKELNQQAAYKMAALHDVLKEHNYTGHALELYLVRLLFCNFADDSGIFYKNQFRQYIMNSRPDGSDLAGRMAELFDILNTPHVERQPTLSDEVRAFEYINGGLFREVLRPAAFSSKMRQMLLDCAEFDWSYISPSIFGAMFQGVMDQKERRELGAHYTSEQNILKLIKPLFLDELCEEFERVKSNEAQLEYFHNKLAQLTFLDPACGCGNFLIITYRELRLLELEILKMQINDSKQLVLGDYLKDHIKVNVGQFYGIEYEEFPGQIAQVGLWLMDHQMNNLVSYHFGLPFNRLPLHDSATIFRGHENGNALQIDWETVVPKQKLNFIMGNPPFIGASNMSAEQKEEAVLIFGKIKLANSIDYVGAWYHKAAAYIQNTKIRVGFVSTNSITQGEQVAPLWSKLLREYQIHIDFAYQTFKWNNDAKGKAQVHCIIIGFSNYVSGKQKLLFDQYGDVIVVGNINPYLVEAPDILVESRGTPICDVPQMMLGNKPSDGGNLIFTEEEKDKFIAMEPAAEPFIKKYVGSEEFINGTQRYCLWLKDADPSWKKYPAIMQRINKVREMRLLSSAMPTREKAVTPQLFFFISQPKSKYLLIPSVSSEKRQYIPIGYMDKDTIASNAALILADATIYHFGILTSNVHMAWMRTVSGRLKSDYRYSGSVVYNTFPWPTPTDEQIIAIEKAAQLVLDVREHYQSYSLADLYNTPMEEPLRKAHKTLDKAVWAAYNGKWKSEAECVADLMQRYQVLVNLEQK